MNDPSGDDEVARLQRLVYGANSTPDERRRAADALQELAVADAADQAADATSTLSEPSGGGAAEAPAVAGNDDAPDPDDDRRLGRRFALRVAAVAGAALVIGILAGWQLAQLTAADADAGALPTPSASPGPRLQADVLAAMPVAAETLAARVFLRPAVPEDMPDIPGMPEGTRITLSGGPAEFRLLATRSDGVRFYAARDGAELCLYVTFPEPADGAIALAGCTQEGRFPEDGIRVDGSSGQASIDATWHPDGSLQMGMLNAPLPGAPLPG
jgi:hypothetical protein